MKDRICSRGTGLVERQPLQTLTSSKWNEEDEDIDQHRTDPIYKVEERSVHACSLGIRVRELLPEVRRRSAADQPGDGDGYPPAHHQGYADDPRRADAKESSVEEEDRRFREGDTGCVDQDKGVCHLPEPGELSKGHDPEVFTAALRNAQEAQNCRSYSEHLRES